MSRWLILRTSGGQTLALAASLRRAGYDAWSPGRTIRRRIPAKTPSGTRVFEREVAILPTFVFAREEALTAIVDLAAQALSPHPAFWIFRHGGRAPLVGDREISGLRDEEVREAAIIKAIHDAETYAEAERIRIAEIKQGAARRRAERSLDRIRRDALRAQGCSAKPDDEVEVIDAPAFVGVRGVFEKADGLYAHVRFGAVSWKIEGWRVLPAPLNDNAASRGIAA